MHLRRLQCGFTLIEVLLAMSLLALLVVLLAASLRIGADSWQAGEDKSSQSNRQAVVYQFFKQRISSLRPLPIIHEIPNGLPGEQVFRGRMQELRFAAPLPAASARKGLQIFELYLDAARLWVRLTPYQQQSGEKPDEPVELLAHIRQINFAYFGKVEENAPLQWQNDWLQFDRLPNLVKVSVVLDDDSFWPDMVFPLYVSETAHAETLAQ
jgi:general secretion pathway protein J